MKRIFLGFDPGGFLGFGWCALSIASDDKGFDIRSGTCSTASEALAAAGIQVSPTAIGINAPMYWSPDGDRKADQIVRGMVLSKGGQSGTVSAVNSLKGASLAQGIMLAALAREHWPEVNITEAHPKALQQIYPEAENFLSGREFKNDHEQDAALAAYTAWAYDKPSTSWCDLRAMESSIFDPLSGSPPVYWFPAT
jgi:hypothetical protein